ncbi:MAG: selenocysteine-specific translation elongation factor [Clostridia bacterium]|nr:selenocysteine-specific translation elongation factor [Clostridia bacterium]
MTDRTHIIVGTAGHVDHGKTALIKALTGQDTDRLPDEKRRGISIDIGFAHLDLPGGRRVSFIDVPGHERFVRNMVAGVHGIDACLLVVAADEGVMPQTREHLEILRLLGVDRGVVALTKTDLVDGEWLDLVRDEVRAEIAGSGFAGAPILAVSSRTGEGLEALRAELARLFALAGERPAHGPARLPIDRSFTVAGFGTVVTGTLVSGAIREGDRLEWLPKGATVRVRGLQVHGHPTTEARAGQRVAVNVTGAEWREVHRGDVLAAPGAFRAESVLAARVHLLSTAPAPLADGARVRLHASTQETIARVVWLEDLPEGRLAPGGSALARLHAARPIVATYGERILIRSLSPATTIGGGVVLDAGRRYRKKSRDDLRRLEALERREAGALLLQPLDEGPHAVEDLARQAGLTVGECRRALEAWAAEGRVVLLLDGEVAVGARRWASLLEAATDAAVAERARHPLRRGWPREEAWRALWPGLERRLGNRLLAEAERAGAIELRGDVVRPPAGREPPLPEALERAVERVAAMFASAGLAPPSLEQVQAELGGVAAAEDVVAHLVDQGRLVAVADGLWFASEAVDAAAERVRAHLAGGRAATMSELREVLGTTRKYALPLAEHFDRVRLTRRDGDVRRLASP